MKMTCFLFNIISVFVLIIGGGRAGVLLDSTANDKDVTSFGEVELTDSNFDRSQVGTIEQSAKSKRIIHETPESRLVLDDINNDYANNDLITQHSQTTHHKVTPELDTSTRTQSAQQELMQQTINQQTNKLDKQTARHSLRMHDHTSDENVKINGAYADLTETLSVNRNGAVEKSVEHREGDYASEDSSKSNTFLLNYIPKTSAGQELLAEMKTTTYGKGSYSNNEKASKTTLKTTPANDEHEVVTNQRE